MPASGLIADLARVSGRDVSRETLDRLVLYESLLREEATRQNLVSASTIGNFWHRHVLDSAQLLKFAPPDHSRWADIGSGAGLPGVVIACFLAGPVTLIEPRRLRADFLHRVVAELDLDAEVVPLKVEGVRGAFDVITARAVANLSALLRISAHLSTRNTVWALPKGRNAEAELVEACKSWHGVFHVEQSVTDPDSRIIVATGVARK